MIRRYIFFYFMAISIPLFIAMGTWQSVRYAALEKETRRLERAQEEWMESNKRLIAGIAIYSSAERIERIASRDLGLLKIRPEYILQIRIEEGAIDD